MFQLLSKILNLICIVGLIISLGLTYQYEVQALSKQFYISKTIHQIQPVGNIYHGDPDNYEGLVKQLQAGDTLMLEAGIYHNHLRIYNLNGTADAPIIIAGPETGERAIFYSDPGFNTVSIVDSSYVEIKNLEIDGRGRPSLDGVKAERHANYAHHITLENLYIHGNDAYGIQTNTPAWGWIIRNNIIKDMSHAIGLGNSDGSGPFIDGLIEGNLILNPTNSGIYGKHQNTRPTGVSGMPTGDNKTIIRHNVIAKHEGFHLKPYANIHLKHWPLSGPGTNDIYEIYGNFLYQTQDGQPLLQGEGNIALYSNIFLNNNGDAIWIQRQHVEPRNIKIFNNTIVANGKGVKLQNVNSDFTQQIMGNAIFAHTPIDSQGGEATQNITAGYNKAQNFLIAPNSQIGQLDLYPKANKLKGTSWDPSTVNAYTDWDEDFNGLAHNRTVRGAYGDTGSNPGWALQLGRKLSGETPPGPTPISTPSPMPTNVPVGTPTPPSGNPDIRPVPTTILLTLPEGKSSTLPLTIHNDGSANLTYEIIKQNTATVRAAQAKPMTWPMDKIDADLQEFLDDHGQASFLVYLKKQANLDDASQIVDRAKRQQQVYETLRNTALDTQADLLAWLDKQQVAGHVTDYRSFFLINAIGVTADRAAVDALAYRDDVAYLELESTFNIPEPEESQQVSAAAVHGIEPGLLKIKANEVWSTLGIRGNGITVGIIDTGVEHTHPALKAQYRGTATGNHDFNWYDATGRFPDSPGDVGGHGTHVAGTIVGSDGGQNQIGVAPGAQWIAARACDPRGQGGCSSFDLLNALQWMLAPCPIGVEPGDDDTKELCDPSKSPDLVSNSWGSSGGGERGYETIINNLRKAGIMPIFAAGNDGEYGDNTISSPGDYASSIAVGAIDGGNRRARFSSRGPSRITSKIKPDISAPGVDIRSAGLNGQYVYNSGTSMATPHLAGVVALMLEANPKLTIEQIEMILKNTATDLGEAGPDYQYGYGLVNALAAVQAATNAQPWLTYEPGEGTINPNASSEIQVTLNAAGLAPGAHTMDLVIASNDPDTPRLTIPVTLIVAEAMAEEVAVQISNQTAKSATITWITNRPTTAEIHYGTSCQNLDTTELDVRGQNQAIEDDVHYVTLKNLQPATKYCFQITEVGQSANSENTNHEFTTGPDIGPGSPQSIYGKVLKDDDTPAQHVIVLLQVVQADSSGSAGKSALLAGLTNGDGYWIKPNSDGDSPLDLNSLRAEDGQNRFHYTAGDKVDVEILGGADCNAKARFDMSDLVENAPQDEAPALRLSCTNLVDMEMLPGWNDEVFPSLEGNNGVSAIMGDADSQNAPFEEVAYWDVETGNWRSKLADVPIGDFPILPCRGYFIRVAEPTLYRAKPGTVTQDSCNIDLKRGWNFVSLSATMPSVNASDACQQISEAGGQITELARWDAATANWRSYGCDQPFGGFVLEPNVPYFIKSDLETQWVPKASDAIAASHKKMNLNTGLSAEQNPTITDIRYANINDGSITVIWRTDKPATGQIHFGNQAGELVNTAYDDRGEAYVGLVHQVTLTSLQPETAYQLEVHSGETIHDNGGLFHRVKTKPTLAIPSIQSGYGQVLDRTGNPIVGAQVYATVSDSAPLSAITNLQGYWSLNLGALRTADGTQYLDVMDGTLDIEVITSVGITGSQSLAIESLTPAPTLVLDEGYSIYLPLITR